MANVNNLEGDREIRSVYTRSGRDTWGEEGGRVNPNKIHDMQWWEKVAGISNTEKLIFDQVKLTSQNN